MPWRQLHFGLFYRARQAGVLGLERLSWDYVRPVPYSMAKWTLLLPPVELLRDSNKFEWWGWRFFFFSKLQCSALEKCWEFRDGILKCTNFETNIFLQIKSLCCLKSEFLGFSFQVPTMLRGGIFSQGSNDTVHFTIFSPLSTGCRVQKSQTDHVEKEKFKLKNRH